MAYQIDQSGKIEQTNRATVVTLANGFTVTIKISAAEKQKLLKAVREIENPNTNYIYKIFAVMIFLLLDKKIKYLAIDKEYPGHDSVIKDTLIYLSNKFGKKLPEISFTLVGKKCKAHKTALLTFQKRKKPDMIIKSEQIIEVLYVQKKVGGLDLVKTILS